jgi:hypothetical protein
MGMTRCRLENPVRVDQPMILISQIQRSGGTLLSRLFDAHPACFAHPYELSWGRPEKWHWPMIDHRNGSAGTNFNQLDQEWVRRLAKKGYYKKGPIKKTGKYPFVFDYKLQKTLFKRLHAQNGSARAALDNYLTSFFNAWLDYQNLYRSDKRFVTSFIPRLLMFPDSLERFRHDYPDGFIISSVRHPAGWYASAIKHKYDQYGTLERILDFWMGSTRAIVRAKRQLGDRLILIDFESLVADPATFMRRVCRRTGLPWHETLSEPTFNGMPVKSNSHYENVSHVDPDASRRYQAVLPTDSIDRIEQIAGDLQREAAELIQTDA